MAAAYLLLYFGGVVMARLPKNRRKAPSFSYGDIRQVSVANKPCGT